MKRVLLLIITFVIGSALFPVVASAHRSGCHRWHSCPSDSGSYTCGDWGYTSQCGGTAYTQPDYTSQGETNGKAQAIKDILATQNYATNQANNKGYEDGRNGANSSPYVLSSPFCDKTFTYDTPQPEQYVSAFKTAYRLECGRIYSEAYGPAYTTSYAKGKSDPKTTAVLGASTTASKNKSNTSYYMWVWLAGGSALVAAPSAMKYIEEKKK